MPDKVKCPYCNSLIDLTECETDKYWDADENGVDNHLLRYKCPECEHWFEEVKINERN